MQSQDRFTTVLEDGVLATVPANTPQVQFLPYIGDYASLLAANGPFQSRFARWRAFRAVRIAGFGTSFWALKCCVSGRGARGDEAVAIKGKVAEVRSPGAGLPCPHLYHEIVGKRRTGRGARAAHRSRGGPLRQRF